MAPFRTLARQPTCCLKRRSIWRSDSPVRRAITSQDSGSSKCVRMIASAFATTESWRRCPSAGASPCSISPTRVTPSSRCSATSSARSACPCHPIHAIIMSRIAEAPAQVIRSPLRANSCAAGRVAGNCCSNPSRLSQCTATLWPLSNPAEASMKLPFSMPPSSTPKRAIRFTQRTTRRSRNARSGSKLASTKTVVQVAAEVRSPSTGTTMRLLARTGLPSTEIIFQSKTGLCESQLATNSGSIAAARPRCENSGKTRKATWRTKRPHVRIRHHDDDFR
jgi:hypothetical protein